MVWPLIPFSYSTINYDLPAPAPRRPRRSTGSAPTIRARDVLARLIYGFRISILFGLTLTVVCSLIGIAAGAVQGYFGGLTDLLFQRFIELWSNMPVLYFSSSSPASCSRISGGCSASC